MSDDRNGEEAGRGDYGSLLDAVKREITGSRGRVALLTTDAELIRQYWRIGRHILERQTDDDWGRKAVPRLSIDLRGAFPEAMGYSRTNLLYMRAFAAAWPDSVPQTGRPIPWGHHIVLLDMLDNRATREFYARKTADEGWARGVLITMIKGRLHLRIRHSPPGPARTSPAPDCRSVQREFAGLLDEGPRHGRNAGAPALSENAR
ncbi:DUF1016 N-terminal domain-containing protein [Streptosporangium amethystogenes subsp. fukuiense]|uniref:DUF1016 N-terminal domain-containing protein n=1 Tax=Streptosporangium amethystogenes subsp. fukuiense TaxID=698418 RepID=A0ABW2T1B6_9ACTN